MTTPAILDEAERFVHALAGDLTRVRPGECLCCYLARQLLEFDCDGTHRHAERFRDTTAPRATALLDRLSRLGGCCCDCELFLNGYQPHPARWTAPRTSEGDPHHFLDPAAATTPLPTCGGVRRGSVRPCANWTVIPRPGW